MTSRGVIRAVLGLGHILVAGIADTEFGRYILAYMVQQLNLPPERIAAALRRTGRDPERVEEIMGTAAQTWLEQGRDEGIARGRAEGIAQGRAEGKAETFLRQARLKFGLLSPERTKQVRRASPEELDIWLDALILAGDIDAVFGETNRRN